MLRDSYSNTRETGFTGNFFQSAASRPYHALFAVPFFTTYEPIKALTKRSCQVSLIVRLCEATTFTALEEAFEDPLVTVRYYTDRKFHAKLYIIDDVALVGSANLTKSGMWANREVSIVLKNGRDDAFNALPGIFDDLWDHADVLTEKILEDFETVGKLNSSKAAQSRFDRALREKVPDVTVPSIVVGSGNVSKERRFLQAFRRKYDEDLIPFYQEIMRIAMTNRFGRDEYRGQDPDIEMGRFLGWVRLVHGPKDSWREVKLLDAAERVKRVSHYVSEWQSPSDTVARDMLDAEAEIKNIARIRDHFASPATIKSLSHDEIFDALIGCHAFLEQLRFTKGGLPNLRREFALRNPIKRLQKTLSYLLHGNEDPVQRAYDCLYDPRYQLAKFGEASVMELLGWHSNERPPFNNRTIRGMRFLGYDVEHHVLG